MKLIEFDNNENDEVLKAILEKLGTRSFIAISYDKDRNVYQKHAYNMTPQLAIFCCELAKQKILEENFE